MRIERLQNNPIITPNMDERMGTNINGPSLIQVPGWVKNPLGSYYLYFGHHKGDYIRLAYAERLEGPWSTYKAGVLNLKDSHCLSHLASPDVHIDEKKQEIVMYYHGPVSDKKEQQSKVATSKEGLSFTAYPENLGNPYFRAFRWNGIIYTLGMPGIFYRSRDGRTNFQKGPTLFNKNMRHSAIKLDHNVLSVFYSNAYDCPEHILCSTIELTSKWTQWKASRPRTVLKPEKHYEGAQLPLEPSKRGWVQEKVNQLRDPGLYREGKDTYLLYSIAGEHGIAIAKLYDE